MITSIKLLFLSLITIFVTTLKQEGGPGFIQFGNWRIGNVDGTHFSFSHKSGYTSVIYRKDGTVHKGPRQDFGLWNRQLSFSDVTIGQKFLEFSGVWRIAQIDDSHLSLSHLSGKTCMIWRKDGTKHPGPRQDFNAFFKKDNPEGVQFGINVVKIGFWFIGQVDARHLSIGRTQKTAEILRSDGLGFDGPRDDYKLANSKTLILK